MGIQISNNFEVPLGLSAAWDTLLDVPRIAACMPGAQLTRVIDDHSFEGSIDVKMGPMLFSFAGTIVRTQADAAAQRMVLEGKVHEKRNRGHAQATVTVSVAAAEAGSRVDVASDITLGGQVAQYGRGAGMVKAVADEIIKRFAANLRAEIERCPPVAAAAPGSTGGAMNGAANGAALVAASLTIDGAAGGAAHCAKAASTALATSPPSAAAAPHAQPAAAAQPAPPAAPATPPTTAPQAAGSLSLGSVLWAVFSNWLRGLFGRRA